MSKLSAAYLAGLIDGDGHIGINNHTKGKYKEFEPVIEIRLTDREMIEWLKNSYGGNMYGKQWWKRPQDRIAYTWKVTHSKGEALLKKVYPFLRIKKRQAEILLKFYKTIGRENNYEVIMDKQNRPHKKLTVAIIEERSSLNNQIKALNLRGLAVVETKREDSPMGDVIVQTDGNSNHQINRMEV